MANKRGLIGKIILGVFLVLVLIVVVAGIYFYNFHVFETVRVCVGDSINTEVLCVTDQDCLDLVEEKGMVVDLGDAPEFILDGYKSIIDAAVYCNETCFLKKIRGLDLDEELVVLDRCVEGEVEFLFEVRGKEGLEVLKWAEEIQ